MTNAVRYALGVFAVSLLTAACSDPETAKREYLENGNTFFRQARYAEAIVEYRNAIKQDPLFGEARFKLAEAFEKSGNIQGAYGEYIRAADLLPDDIAVQNNAVRFLLLAQQWEDARTRVRRVLQRDPQNVEAQIHLGTALAGLRDFDGAIEEIEEAIGLDPSRGTSYSNLAVIRLAQGERDEARKAFERAVEIEPTSVVTWLALAHFQLSTGSVADAESSLKRALKIDPKNAVANRAMAAIYTGTNRAAEAEPYLKAVVDAVSTDEARFVLVDYYLRFGRKPDAQNLLRTMVGQSADSAGAEMRLAQIEYIDKQTARAHAMLDAVLEREPNNVSVLVTKARWLLQEGKTQEALARASKAAEVDPSSIGALYLLGLVQATGRDFDAATKSFGEVLRLNPLASAAQLQLSRLRLFGGDAETAVQHASAVLRSVPGNPDARVALARGLIAQRDIPRATKEVAALVKQYPNVSVVHALNGSLLVVTGDTARAKAQYERALALDPSSFEAVNGLVSIDVVAGRIPQARAFVDKRIVAESNRPELHVLSARVYAAARDMMAAENALRTAIKLDSSYTPAYGMLGRVLLEQRRLDQARAEFDQVVSRNPKDVGAATMAAMIVELQNNIPEAKRRYTSVLLQNPRAGVAANNLAWIYAEEGSNMDEALSLAQTAATVLPDRAEPKDTLGWVLYKKGLFRQAVTALEQAVAKDPDESAIHYHLGLAYEKNGDARLARNSLQAALKLDLKGRDADQARATLKQLAALGF